MPRRTPPVAVPSASGRPRSVEAVRALARASRALERASGELSLAQYRVLAAVAAGDVRASRIASRLAVGKPTISATVDTLCQRGLLARAGVVGDQRAAALRLTAAGQALLRDTEDSMIERIDDLARRTADPGAVLDALVLLGGAIDALLAERGEPTPAGRR